MLLWAVLQTALVVPVELVLGANPPWKKPHVIPALLRRFPMFWPDMAAVAPAEQSSKVGSRSLMSTPLATEVEFPVTVAPAVSPETRLRAPGVDGPYPVPNELSFIAKVCA